MCEEHFKKHTARDDTGRYIMRLPRREDQGRLGESYEQATRRFQEHPDLHQAYSEFMQEYEELGHMNQINEDASSA
jgi:histone deacetylase complex regulatory component SIN3